MRKNISFGRGTPGMQETFAERAQRIQRVSERGVQGNREKSMKVSLKRIPSLEQGND